MLWTSFSNLLFLVAAIPLYFAMPRSLKVFYLLCVSILFLLIQDAFSLPILLIAIVVDYGLGQVIHGTDRGRVRTAALATSIAFNLGLYLLLHRLGLSVLGYSFYTFTKLAYIVDLYQKRTEPSGSLLSFASAVSFFPNITAGPIEKVDHLLPQLRLGGRFDPARITSGLRLILWGIFKKALIADRIAPLVDAVYAQPQDFHRSVLLQATLLFAFQIYADFSGYTDIARGIARLLGVDLFENFRRPYLATSILDFWRRWHMSLTNWVRSYVFMPFSRYALRRVGRQWARIIEVSAYFLTMALVGLWHGPFLSFLVWGLLHGLLMALEALFRLGSRRGRRESRAATGLRVVAVFLLVDFTWIFFRAGSIDDALYIAGQVLTIGAAGTGKRMVEPAIFGGYDALIMFAALILLIGVDIFQEWRPELLNFEAKPIWLRWSVYYALTIGILVFGELGVQDFIYQRF